MNINAPLNRRLRMGLIGGGGQAFIGRVHATAATLDQRAELVEEPALIPEAIEEILRSEAPTEALARRPTREVELRGVPIPPDSRVLVSFGAANHDDRVFEEPERFDIHRTNKRHLSLGQGSHFCMGASLARLEARIGFEELLARFPTYRVASPPRWATSRWARSHPVLEASLRAGPGIG